MKLEQQLSNGTIDVPAGWWELRLQREFLPSVGERRRADFD